MGARKGRVVVEFATLDRLIPPVVTPVRHN
ncbi:MAG: hypothetical protein QOK39_1366 [Acidimicrobiaceae bacterium]|jgi:hypothetical protein|nr:hypothetical protein [Acidimicrobiaceae bacterium]